jgi:hypothetical protein
VLLYGQSLQPFTSFGLDRRGFGVDAIEVYEVAL